ncbi:immunoglobulin E-set [Roridomyces roridus]|uniref:Immunoglobulin E-set n=1 Tax=Roridomyces roridus TaxID=1738132 RepID=A0AAD7C4B0_9AGAR|nr:immunoglobulin E-set [Roridomyces roridus]
MSHHDEDHEVLGPTTTPGYKVGAAKTTDEYAQLDAEDESLARWKASLGIVAGAGGDTSRPKVEVLTMELHSDTMPAGKTIAFDLAQLRDESKDKKTLVIDKAITIKEDVDYNVCIKFRVNHGVISGVRYKQVVKRAGIPVDTLDQMLGSYPPNKEPYTKNFDTDHSPKGMLARSGKYSVTSVVVDDDKEVYAKFEWTFKLEKEWA